MFVECGAADREKPLLGRGIERAARPLGDELFQDVVDERAALRRLGQLPQRLERL